MNKINIFGDDYSWEGTLSYQLRENRNDSQSDFNTLENDSIMKYENEYRMEDIKYYYNNREKYRCIPNLIGSFPISSQLFFKIILECLMSEYVCPDQIKCNFIGFTLTFVL